MRLMFVKFCFGVLAALSLAACAATQKTVEWHDPTYAGKKFDNILVIGVAKEGTVRRVFESNLVDGLMGKGRTAIPSFRIMDQNEKISEETVKAAINGKNIDAVLVTRLIGVEEQEVYHPPKYSPEWGYYAHYSAAYSQVYQPGYYERYKVLKLETILFDVKTEKPVWSMQSDTIDPKSKGKLILSAIEAAIKALSEQGLI